jgi:hypothetical protein
MTQKAFFRMPLETMATTQVNGADKSIPSNSEEK